MSRLLIPIAGLLLLLPGCSSPPNDDPQLPLGDFSLTERSGRTVRRDDLLGKVWVASFFFSRCGRECPMVSGSMARLQKELAGQLDVVLVSFSVDPEHDKPEVLQRYADGYEADAERWLFLTGQKEEIYRLLDQGFRVGVGQQDNDLTHSPKLVLVDRQGQVRGYYEGMVVNTGLPEEDEARYENGLRRLKRRAAALAQEGRLDLPSINALLNATSAVLLVTGYAAIRRRRVGTHKACMLAALVVSAVFLTCYLYYHLGVKKGAVTQFADQAPGAPAWVGTTYYVILRSHTILAAVAVPLALVTAYLGLRGRLARHVTLARWTLPIWLYVSVTGVAVYWMLYRLYPPW